MNDDKLQELKKHFWWMIPLTIIALILLVTGFDPIGNLLGPQAERIVTIAIMVGVAIYAIHVSGRHK